MVALSISAFGETAMPSPFGAQSNNCAGLVNRGFLDGWINHHPADAAPAIEEYAEIDRTAKSIEAAGSVFVLGLAVLQVMDPLPAAELAARFALLCWTLTAFRMIRVWDGRWMRFQAIGQAAAMAAIAFLLPWPTETQLALDMALLGAGWGAIAARWKLTFSAARIARDRAAAKLHRRRLQLLGAAA